MTEFAESGEIQEKTSPALQHLAIKGDMRWFGGAPMKMDVRRLDWFGSVNLDPICERPKNLRYKSERPVCRLGDGVHVSA